MSDAELNLLEKSLCSTDDVDRSTAMLAELSGLPPELLLSIDTQPLSEFAADTAVDLPRHTWSLMNRFRTGQDPCHANLHKRGLAQSPSCDCGQRQTMNHIVDMCPLTGFEGGLNLLHEVDDDAVILAGMYSDCSTREINCNQCIIST